MTVEYIYNFFDNNVFKFENNVLGMVVTCTNKDGTYDDLIVERILLKWNEEKNDYEEYSRISKRNKKSKKNIKYFLEEKQWNRNVISYLNYDKFEIFCWANFLGDWTNDYLQPKIEKFFRKFDNYLLNSNDNAAKKLLFETVKESLKICIDSLENLIEYGRDHIGSHKKILIRTYINEYTSSFEIINSDKYLGYNSSPVLLDTHFKKRNKMFDE